MITIIKLGPLGEEKIRYTGEVLERVDGQVVVGAPWTLGMKDLGYTRFEPGDYFTEYYYAEHWFNIFAIVSAEGVRKGWYCNVTEPAQIYAEHIEQVDLFLDVWVDHQGEVLVLDEDEFAAATTMSERQRIGAQAGLQDLLRTIRERQRPFHDLAAR